MHQQLVQAVLGWAALALGSAAADWPQYRGPNHDGSANGSIRTNWSENPPQILWQTSLGPGWSSPVAVGSRVFTQYRPTTGAANREHAVALDANTGRLLWSRDVDLAQYTDLAGYDEALDGPRSTPSVDGEHVYLLTSQMRLYCLRVDSGAIVWQRNLIAELGSRSIAWQNAASPLVIGDLIFLNSNAAAGGTLMAVRKSDGAEVWRSGAERMTHATPVYASIGGAPQVIFLTLSGLVGVTPETGSALWRFPFTPSATSTAASPVVSDNHVYASAAYARGAWTARVSLVGGSFSATQAWQQRADPYQNHWATPVAFEGHLYSVGGPGPLRVQLVCLDAATGTNRWAQGTVGTRPLGYGSVQRIGDVLVVINEGGELTLVQADPTAYRQLGVFPTGLNYCWNHASIAHGRIYLRDPASIIAIDVAAALPPLPELHLSIDRGATAETVALTVRAADESPLDLELAARIELRASTSLLTPAPEWLVIPAQWAETDGDLETVLPATEEFQALRAQEKPAGE